jgi:hypothetical protein
VKLRSFSIISCGLKECTWALMVKYQSDNGAETNRQTHRSSGRDWRTIKKVKERLHIGSPVRHCVGE